MVAVCSFAVSSLSPLVLSDEASCPARRSHVKAYMGLSTSCGLFPHRPMFESSKEIRNGMDESGEYSTTDAKSKDKRRIFRYSITGAVQFQWRAADGQWYDDVGITHDIGKGGVFIESDSIPPVGSPLKLTVTLPSESTPNVTLQLSGSGTVCHVRQGRTQPSGFGASAIFHVDVPMPTGNTEGGEP